MVPDGDSATIRRLTNVSKEKVLPACSGEFEGCPRAKHKLLGNSSYLDVFADPEGRTRAASNSEAPVLRCPRCTGDGGAPPMTPGKKFSKDLLCRNEVQASV